ncbi:MAG: hypothetical protein HKO65_07960 [Gemmatimonadetes bacterium]|nr:hypothetical protein [Gemmatimonadota bacterium]NNM05025.1 hypothetical protein [Gemmatimonadota bacterium]
MTLRASVVFGTISFLAVAVLSLANLDKVEGEGFYMQGIMPLEVSAPETDLDSATVEGASTETPSTEDPTG